ncbi:PPR repeat protein [Cooperia oncophora]
MEEKRKLEPDQHTFEVLLTGIARKGDVEGCRKMVYEMARRGFLVNSACNDALVYCFAVRGHHAKADSLAEQALGKYGADAVSSAQGACAKAAAARVDLNRLRKVLRRAVMGAERKLILSSSDVLETIWLLAEKSRDGDGAEFVNLTEQMLNHTNHESGFFRLLIREVERHISHQHYYTAVALLEDTNRIADCLKNQQKSLFLDQMIAQLSRQVIRNEVNVVKLNDIANRVVAIFQNHPNA